MFYSFPEVSLGSSRFYSVSLPLHVCMVLVFCVCSFVFVDLYWFSYICVGVDLFLLLFVSGCVCIFVFIVLF